MVSVDNENAWNEYVKSHEEAKPFRFKVIPNWDDIVDLCAKDRATRNGSETAFDADEIMSRESNQEEMDSEHTDGTMGLEEPSLGTAKSRRTQCQRRSGREKDGIAASMKQVANSLDRFLETTSKKTKEKDVHEILDELKKRPDLDLQQWIEVVNWLTTNPSQLVVVRVLPIERKKAYIVAFID